MTQNPLLEVKDLEVVYKTDLETVHAVNGLSFSMDRGQTLGLVGETGAGKTTTALSILRLLPERTGRVLRGSIRLNGGDLLSLKPADMRNIRGSKISMIFQDPMSALNPIFTVGRQISEALLLHNGDNLTRDQIEDRTEQTLELVGIPASRKGEYPHQFSGGMRQRVVIAMALACNPELLIADEPTTALDVTIQAQVLAMMNELQEKLGTATVMITHDLGIVAQTCDHVAVMYAGEIVEYGSMRDVFNAKERHPYTEGLFGSIPDLKSSKRRLSPIEGLMPDPTALPAGCKFAPRCPRALPACRETPPPVCECAGRSVRCQLFK